MYGYTLFSLGVLVIVLPRVLESAFLRYDRRLVDKYAQSSADVEVHIRNGNWRFPQGDMATLRGIVRRDNAYRRLKRLSHSSNRSQKLRPWGWAPAIAGLIWLAAAGQMAPPPLGLLVILLGVIVLDYPYDLPWRIQAAINLRLIRAHRLGWPIIGIGLAWLLIQPFVG